MRTRHQNLKQNALALAAAAALGPLAVMPASAAVCTWNVAAGNWAALANWLACVAGNGNPAGVPGAADTATIGAAGIVTLNTGQSVLNLNNAGQINIDAFGLNLVGGGSTVNGGGVINVGGASTANLGVAAGHNINNTGGVINVGAGSVINQFGSTITGGNINTTGTGALVVFASSANFLSGVTLGGRMDMASGFALQRITNGLTLNNGTIEIANQSALSFEGTSTLAGTGSIVLGAVGGATNRIALDGNGTTTFAAGVTVHGHSGSIGGTVNIGGTQALVNNGAISADVAGGTISINDSAVTNNGTLSAFNGGTLVLNSSVAGGASGQIVAGAGSTVLQNGVTLSGTINTGGNGSFRASGSAANFLDGVTVNGNLDMASAFSLQRVKAGGLVLNGTINIENQSALSFEGDGGLTGNATIELGSLGGATNRITLDGTGTTTFAAGTTVHGHSGTIGNSLNIGGTQTLVNNGTISADVATGVINITDSAVTNNGTLSALNGGTLLLSSNVTGGALGQIVAGAGSTVVQNGVEITGVINTSGNGLFRANASAANFLNAATLNGSLDLASAFALERVTAGGLVLNGTINVANQSALSFEGTGGLTGNATIVMGSVGGASNRIALDGTGTTTFAAGTTVHGHSGTIGNSLSIGGTQTLINNGTISADELGGTFNITDSAVTNNGTLSALNGGTLLLSSDVTGGASGQIVAGAGSTVVQNGVTITGIVNTSGSGLFQATASAANFLNAATLNGNLDLATAFALERVTAGGLVLNGTINVANQSVLSFEGTGGLTGNATIVMGSVGGGSNRIALDGTGTTTFAAGTTVRGHSGTIGNAHNIGGTQTLVNNGTINAELAGGTITLADSALVNNGLARAQAGTMNVGVPLSGTGTLQVDTTGAMNLAAGAKAQGVLAMGAAGAALNLNTGNLTLSSDYTNVGAGTGNSFNRRAGVTGTGQIVAGGDVSQVISGAAVTNGATTNATLTVGNMRVGANTFNVQIGNAGTTGPTLRGAIQTSVGGGNITDTRLTGAGVTASNYNAGAPGANSGNLGVTFTATGAGALAPLTGQAINLRSNFENIADQKLNIVLAGGAAAYNAAVGSTAPAPVTVLNQRIGGGNSSALTVSNTAAAGAFSEDLRATFGANGGAATHNGGIVNSLIAGGSDGAAMSVGVDTSSAGAKAGSVTLNYQTTGTVNSVSNGLGLAGANPSQTINVSGNVYQVAQPSPAGLPATVNLGNFRAGSGAQAAPGIVIVNTSIVPAGFQEGLAAAVVLTTGQGSGSGFADAIAGGSGTLNVGLSGINAGTNSGTIMVQLRSNGTTTTGSNGLGNLDLGGPQTVTVNGTGWRLAQANLQPATINFGNVLVGSSQAQFLNIQNTAVADGFSERLDASFKIGGTTGDATHNAASISLLAAGAPVNGNTMSVGINTGSSGAKAGQVVVAFNSNGNGTSGLGITGLPDQNIGVLANVTANVGSLASAGLSPTTVDFGKFREGTVAGQTQQLTVSNLTVGLGEGLHASFGASTGGASHNAGTITSLATGGTDNSTMGVTLNGLASAGAKSGTQTVNFASDGSFNAGVTTALPAQAVGLAAEVYRLATAGGTATVNLAARRVGDAAATGALTLSNSAASDGFSEGLRGTFGAAPAGFGVSGAVSTGLIAAGASEGRTVSLSTANAGSFGGNLNIALSSDGAGTSGFAALGIGSKEVAVAGKVYTPAVGQLATATVDFGIVRVGDTPSGRRVGRQCGHPVGVRTRQQPGQRRLRSGRGRGHADADRHQLRARPGHGGAGRRGVVVAEPGQRCERTRRRSVGPVRPECSQRFFVRRLEQPAGLPGGGAVQRCAERELDSRCAGPVHRHHRLQRPRHQRVGPDRPGADAPTRHPRQRDPGRRRRQRACTWHAVAIAGRSRSQPGGAPARPAPGPRAMNKEQFWTATVLAGSCLLLAATNVALSASNRALQGEVGVRQQYVQQSVQLEGLYREIIRALAELGARNNDEDVRALLQRHGISYTVNAPAPAAPVKPVRK